MGTSGSVSSLTHVPVYALTFIEQVSFEIKIYRCIAVSGSRISGISNVALDVGKTVLDTWGFEMDGAWDKTLFVAPTFCKFHQSYAHPPIHLLTHYSQRYYKPISRPTLLLR